MKKLCLLILVILTLPLYASANDQPSFLLKLYNDTYQSLCNDESSDESINGMPNNWYSNNNSINGEYCSPEEAGFYMLSHIGAAENNLISKKEAKERIEKTLKTLKGLPTSPTNQGLYYRYYPTRKPEDKKIPSIGNAMLAASLMTIRKWADENNFTELSKNCSIIVNKINLSVFYNKSSNLFYHDLDKMGKWDYYSNEGRLVSFIAYALGNINESEFKKNLMSLNQFNLYYDVSTNLTNKTGTRKDVLVNKASWDGSMFTYLAPALFINETRTNYQDATINPAVYAQIVYANHSGYRANGTTVWGISDAYNEKGRYCEDYCGAPPTAANLSNNSYEDCPGLIAPYASAMALLSSYSTNATENLIVLSRIPNLYSNTYGFKDTFNVNTGNVADRFVALDQEWIILALMNKLNGTIWRYFYQNPEVVKAHNVMYPTTELNTGAARLAGDTKIRIINPQNGAIVKKYIDISGISNNITAQNLWIMTYPYGVNRYYPPDFPVNIMENGNWSTQAVVGSDMDSGLEFKIFAVLADEKANKAIIDYLDKCEASRSWPGMEQLPYGAMIYDKVSVTRK